MSDTAVRLDYFLDSLKDAFVFCDLDHVIRYMNKAAFVRYVGRPAAVGRSIFDCHNAESNAMIVSIVERFFAGEDDVFLSDRKGERIFMRAVRDDVGALVGYYERYEVSCMG
ncbi:MAG: PAS domain-containing protein [Chlorobiaceae bacterium]